MAAYKPRCTIDSDSDWDFKITLPYRADEALMEDIKMEAAIKEYMFYNKDTEVYLDVKTPHYTKKHCKQQLTLHLNAFIKRTAT